MLAQFSEHINRHFSFLKDKKLLVAVSGGIDSVVLTHILHRLKLSISLAHYNFCLRGEASDQDAIFVRELANQLQIPVFTKSFNTQKFAKQQKLSIQVAARELRYGWFDELIDKNRLDFLLTAHHTDDNLETFLINFSRGTGLDGLTGIPERNVNIVRPLLPFSRKLIEEYAKENNIKWREDVTNIETKYLRNKIRHQVIPVLKELNPSLLSSFNKTLENLKASRQIINDRLKEVSDSIIVSNDEQGLFKFNIAEIQKLKNTKAYLYQLLKPYGFTEWNDVNDLLNAQSGKQILSNTHRLVKDRDFLLLSELPENKEEDFYNISELDQELITPYFSLRLSSVETKDERRKKQDIIEIDKDVLKFPLSVRKWKSGDYFYPLGMQGKKKLSKFFKDEKFSLLEKEKIWLLCSDDQIVWLIGKRLDDRYKITNKTKNTLKIENLA